MLVVPPLPQSRARRALSQRGTVRLGIGEDVRRTAALISMKPQKPRNKNPKPSKARGRSTDRSRSPKPKGKGKRVCKFWKQGRCDHGDECNYLHEGSAGKPRQATPARSASSDFKEKEIGQTPDKEGFKSPGRSKSR